MRLVPRDFPGQTFVSLRRKRLTSPIKFHRYQFSACPFECLKASPPRYKRSLNTIQQALAINKTLIDPVLKCPTACINNGHLWIDTLWLRFRKRNAAAAPFVGGTNHYHFFQRFYFLRHLYTYYSLFDQTVTFIPFRPLSFFPAIFPRLLIWYHRSLTPRSLSSQTPFPVWSPFFPPITQHVTLSGTYLLSLESVIRRYDYFHQQHVIKRIVKENKTM